MVDKIARTSKFMMNSMSAAEKRIFKAIKRDLLKEIVTPKNSDRIMVDIVAAEYVKYVRAAVAQQPRIAISSAKAMREYLSELNLTAKSRAETSTSSTLSNIFKIMNKKEDTNARN